MAQPTASAPDDAHDDAAVAANQRILTDDAGRRLRSARHAWIRSIREGPHYYAAIGDGPRIAIVQSAQVARSIIRGLIDQGEDVRSTPAAALYDQSRSAVGIDDASKHPVLVNGAHIGEEDVLPRLVFDGVAVRRVVDDYESDLAAAFEREDHLRAEKRALIEHIATPYRDPRNPTRSAVRTLVPPQLEHLVNQHDLLRAVCRFMQAIDARPVGNPTRDFSWINRNSPEAASALRSLCECYERWGSAQLDATQRSLTARATVPGTPVYVDVAFPGPRVEFGGAGIPGREALQGSAANSELQAAMRCSVKVDPAELHPANTRVRSMQASGELTRTVNAALEATRRSLDSLSDRVAQLETRPARELPPDAAWERAANYWQAQSNRVTREVSSLRERIVALEVVVAARAAVVDETPLQLDNSRAVEHLAHAELMRAQADEIRARLAHVTVSGANAEPDAEDPR